MADSTSRLYRFMTADAHVAYKPNDVLFAVSQYPVEDRRARRDRKLDRGRPARPLVGERRFVRNVAAAEASGFGTDKRTNEMVRKDRRAAKRRKLFERKGLRLDAQERQVKAQRELQDALMACTSDLQRPTRAGGAVRGLRRPTRLKTITPFLGDIRVLAIENAYVPRSYEVRAAVDGGVDVERSAHGTGRSTSTPT